MRKRVIKPIVLLVLTAVLSVCAWASVASGVCGESLRWKLYEDGLFEIRGSGAMLDYGGVTRVPWEELKSRIKTIEIKSGAAGIGAKAFYDCDNLTSIVFSETVTSIGKKAFGDCMNLKELKLPGSLMYIETGAFYNCNRIASITVEENSTFFSNDENGVLFDKDKTRLVLYPAGCIATEYVIPEGVINIADSAFENSIYLTNVVIPDGVKIIGDDAFNSAEQLTSINMPDSVTRVGDRAFAGCVGLTAVEISPGIERIGEKAFLGCDNITTVYYGGTKEQWRYVTIEPHNDSLLNAEIIFGEEMPTAPKTAAGGTCGTNLTWTLSDDGVLTISGEGRMTDWLYSSDVPWYSYIDAVISVVIEDGVTSIGVGAFAWCDNLTSIEIPDSVTSIGECAFRYCTGLTSIKIPEGVTSIRKTAISGCTSLTSITVDENNQHYSNDEDGVLFNKDKTTLVFYPAGKTATSYIVPKFVTSIGECAFCDCTGLTSIELHEGITSIGESAFFCCKGLTSIEIPEGVKSIGRYAFFSCEGLTSIEIPEGITNIEEHMFSFCRNLKSIKIPDSVTSIGEDAFSGCESLTSIKIPDSVTSIGEDAFDACHDLTIYGNAGSYAYVYAMENKIPFIAVTNQKEPKVVVNGKMVLFEDQNPVIEDGRTLVPARGVFEALGAVVTWDDSTKTATVKTDEKEIAVQIGSNCLVVNGEVIEIDVPAKIINGRTMIPLRAVAEALDCEVGWDAATYTAIISK